MADALTDFLNTKPAPKAAPAASAAPEQPAAAPAPSIIIREQGVYQISNELYHSDPCAVPSMTRGTIFDLINETPAHAFFNHPKLNPKGPEDQDEAEAKFDLGTAWHSLLFEGDQIAVVVDPRDYPGAKGAIPKGWTTDAMRAARDAARAAGKIPMLPPQHQKVMDMVTAAHIYLRNCELGIKNLHEEFECEQTYVWQEGDTWFRVRPDAKSRKKFGGRTLILDGKSVTQSANPDRFKPTEYGKDIQHALYRRGVQAVEGGDRPRFLFLVQEAFAPYLCSLVGLDPQTQQIAEQKCDYGKFMWEQCLATWEWPAYPMRACYVESKPWEVAAWETKAASIGTEE